MNTLDKISRLLEMIPVLLVFNNLINDFQNKFQSHKFTKLNFLGKFLINDKENKQKTQIIK